MKVNKPTADNIGKDKQRLRDDAYKAAAAKKRYVRRIDGPEKWEDDVPSA